eukprot:717241-Pleurochrysis_carterae.AAC.1
MARSLGLATGLPHFERAPLSRRVGMAAGLLMELGLSPYRAPEETVGGENEPELGHSGERRHLAETRRKTRRAAQRVIVGAGLDPL